MKSQEQEMPGSAAPNLVSDHSRASLGLKLAQLVWVILVVVNVARFTASVIVYYRGGNEICTASTLTCHGALALTSADVAHLQADGLSIEQWVVYSIAYRLVVALVFWSVGLLIFVRKRDGAALTISLFLMLIGSIGGFTGFLGARFPEYTLLLNLTEYPAWVSFALFFFTFPNGRVVPRAGWAVIGLWSLLFLFDILFPLIDKQSAFYNALSAIAWTGMFVGGAASVVYRYRSASTQTERRQIKWVVSAVVVSVALILGLLLLPPFPSWTTDQATYSSMVLTLNVITNLAFTLIPLAIGVAVFRYRLYDIDLIIRRTLIYGVLTALLALFYFGSVTLLQRMLSILTGPQPDLAIVVSTLAIAALSIPLRNRIQRLIDRRLYRRKYDAQKVLATFGEKARDEVDLQKLSDELLSVVQETMQPASASVWLKNTGEARGRTQG